MVMQQKLLQAATAALYMGPLLAGLSGFGWAMLMPFMSVFLMWIMILRPHQWPQSHAEWLRAKTWISVLAIVLSQLLLISVLFGIGRGIGGVMGFVPLFHPALPVAISFIAIPMSRLFWDAEKALAQGLTIDELLYPRQDPGRGTAAVAAVAPEVAVAPLLAFPDDASLQSVGPALEDVLDDASAWARFAALGAALEAAPARHRALREAIVIWSTDPELVAANSVPSALRVAFRVAGRDKPLLGRLLPRAVALARALPQRHAQFPDRSELEALQGEDLTGQVAADLAALILVLGAEAKSQTAAGKPMASRRANLAGMA